MLLSVLREFHSGSLKYRHTYDIISCIEKFHFIFTAVTSQRSSGGISLMYAMHARKLKNTTSGPAKIKVLSDLKQKLRSKIPTYKEFEANFNEIYYSDIFTKQKKLVQYILGKFSMFYSEGIAINPDKMTIEHLAPQNPRQPFAKIPAKNIARLGNLVYVCEDLNKKLDNKLFPDKIALLVKSHTPIDEYLRHSKKWGIQEIDHRTKLLSKTAYEKIWKI
jgi:hypothetical protein